MIKPGEVISYLEMCQGEGTSLQRGMNFHLSRNTSVILMSVRPNAPYADRIEEDGRVLIYEGHDVPRTQQTPVPKNVDQPMKNYSGTFTQNGLFYRAAKKCQKGQVNPALIKVYEKLRSGIWVYNGIFELVDAWQEVINGRKVFKFKLQLTDIIESDNKIDKPEVDLDHNRLIPSQVKLAVWKRDRGRCVKCGSTDNLHFDHIIPFSKGGSSLVVNNIQILCARHNIAKRDRVE